MKIKFLPLMLALCCVACNNSKESRMAANKRLVGKWSVSEIVKFQHNDDSISTKCNSCPVIVFAENETGSINGAGKEILAFSWRLDSTNLQITHSDAEEDSDKFLDDGSYQLLQNDIIIPGEITLMDTAKAIKYILKKGKELFKNALYRLR